LVNESKPIVTFYGGSFDPPHLGHQKIVRLAIEHLEIDKLLVVPAYLNPFKDTAHALPSQRLKWCHTLFDSIDKVSVEAYEIEAGKPMYTFDTVTYFSKVYRVKYLIIGADNLERLSQWHQFEWLNANMTWVIITRDGYELYTNHLRKWKVLTLQSDANSTKIREQGALHYIDKKIKKSVQDVLKGKKQMNIEERVKNIVVVLDEKKAEEIEVFNLEKAEYIAKRVVIANALNSKHTTALFEHLKTVLKTHEDTILAADISDEWIVADLGDILIHIMIPEYRQRYSLEQFLTQLLENQQKEKERI